MTGSPTAGGEDATFSPGKVAATSTKARSLDSSTRVIFAGQVASPLLIFTSWVPFAHRAATTWKLVTT